MNTANNRATDASATLRNARRRASRAKDDKNHIQEDLKTLTREMDGVEAQLAHQEQLNDTLLIENSGLRHSAAALDNSSRHDTKLLKHTIGELEDNLKDEKHAHERTTKKLKKTHDSNTKAHEEKKILAKKVGRFDERLELACNKARSATEKHNQAASSVTMKEKGKMTSKFKALYCNLLDHGVSNENIDAVIHSVYGATNIDVTDHVSARTVSRANVEGLIHAELQIAVELSQAECK
jgi:chromosome segregation ATPase